jgi:phosphoribosylanthranilate isomerase
MSVKVKICGLNSEAALSAAVAGGASHVGFVFYPPSPRAVETEHAAALGGGVPAGIVKVGLFVDAAENAIAEILAKVPLDMLQLHGDETSRRVRDIRRRFGLPVMKALKLASAADLAAADEYLRVADWLLFDAKPPAEMKGALPGGNALSFDWSLIAERSWARPWMLSGGLNDGNLAAAVATSRAMVVDVSSGVEDAPGRKSPAKIASFLKLAASL